MLQQSQNIDYLYIPTSKNLQSLLKTTTFWTAGNVQSAYLIKSQLVNLTKSQNYEYALTKDGSLVKFGHQKTKYCNLFNGLYILSYTDKSFLLTSYDRVKEYHCTDQKQLKNWIELLIRFCVTRGQIQTRFRFLSQINNGNYSKGYLIEDNKQRQFVCKTFQKTDLVKVTKLRDSVIGEMLLLRPIDHPNVIKLLEIHEDNKQIYLIYEYAKGELFQEFQKKKAEKSQFSEQQISNFMKQIFEGLKHIHSLNIMHRDIKLENILVKDSSTIVIADFGLAAKKIPKFEYKKYGTPGYIAPEVLNLKVYNEKIDIFSAGVVAYILLTQQPLFSGNTISAILNQNTAGRIDFNNSKFVCLSKDAQSFLKRVLCLEENQRPSAADCLDSLFLQLQTVNNELGTPQKQKEVRLSYLGSSVLPEQINLSKAKRRSMRQYILLKQAIITEKQKTQMMQQIVEQQQGEEEEQENLIVQETVKNIAGSFYTETKNGQNGEQQIESDSGESMNGEDSSESDDDDANLFLEDDSCHNLSSKLSQLGGFEIKMKR
ncbi:unnamed protein product (macronuclear) [Paramecium tetraurelia]|uniref:Protein kinase domain-containing protein n=1 Tax=Paramecium tetraurelia TaxID=5888 RepID=A0D482_PARTE|nr:uncharacterized protein GSPATT00013315001 [Paramecium tetraurelia]CAK77849.1 unnamed protein product [Paramecium tetraurelia]|eukprot:XP_001445246.1 hypothetical protein (macronuclear) [Paramecium tetraurelia strain d4-2]